MFKAIMILLTVFGIPAQLKAEIACGSSLEWLADTSASIGIYRTISFVGKTPGSDNFMTCGIGETFKGTPPKVTTFDFFPRKRDDLGYFRPAPQTLKDRFLIFFRNDASGNPKPSHYINLSQPLAGGTKGLAINHRFEVLLDELVILRVVKERLAAHPTAKVLPLEENPYWKKDPVTRQMVSGQTLASIPRSAPAHHQIFSGSVCYLLIPEDLLPKP